jgi:hypothetical protein
MKKRQLIAFYFVSAFFFAAGPLCAQLKSSPLWQDVSEAQAAASIGTAQRGVARREIIPLKYRRMALQKTAMGLLLNRAPRESANTITIDGVEISLPLPDGGFGRFRIMESPVMEDGLAAKYPDIKTYVVQGVDDPSAAGRIDMTPRGLRAMVLSAKGSFFIDPYWSNSDEVSIVYYKSDQIDQEKLKNFTCGVAGRQVSPLNTASRPAAARPTGSSLRTYRLALAATGEYSVAVAGSSPTKANVLAAMVTSINRVNTVYEREFSIRMTLVANTDLLIYLNGTTDPYTNSNGSTMLEENQTTIDSIIQNANYDIGHVFSTGGGGIAYLGSVCETGSKAGGVTGNPNPVGDSFDIDYVAHEMGHQFGGNHTFNGTSAAVGVGTRNATTAYEPGSGSTIMAYAGICAPQDLQAHSDDYFHTVNYDEIDAYTSTGAGSAAFSVTATGNTPPAISSLPSSYNIPRQTPFALTAQATDANGDSLTYCWEEFDRGATQNPLLQADNGASPIFRSYDPVASPTRTFPSLTYILNNANNPPVTYGSSYVTGEFLPSTTRTMTFRVSVRDNRAGGGGQNYTSTQVISNSTAGPFLISNFSSSSTIAAGTPQTLTWSVANTTAAPVNCANVKISYSTDGGNTFPVVLASSVANTGTANVTIPNSLSNATTTGRFKVEAVGNIFFDINNANLTITATNVAPTITSFAPTSGVQLTSVVLTGTDFSNASVVNFNGTSASFTINSNTQITALLPATATSGLISVSNTVGTATSVGSFTVIPGPPAPAFSGFTPNNGPVGTSVVITGTNFSNVSSVKFNAVSATHTVNSPTQITTTVPVGATTGPIAVTTSSGTAASPTNFTVLSGSGAPVISSASAASGTINSAITPYQIASSNLPTSFSATNLPSGLSINSAGLISGKPLVSGTILSTISATNAYGTGSAALTFTISSIGGGGATLLAAWDFQTTDAGGTAALASPNTPTVFSANVGSGTIYLDGTNGSSSWLQSTELNSFTGSDLNAGGSTGLSTVTTTPACLALVSSAANGKSIVLKFSMTNYQNLVVSYANRVSSSGFDSQLWETSTNGSTWTSTQTITSATNGFAVQTLGTITALNGAANAYLRITFTGAISTQGNNRLDNIQLNASSTTPGAVVTLTGIGTGLVSTYSNAGTPSAALSVAGSNLSADIVVTAPAGFEIAKTAGGSYASTQTFTQVSGAVASTPLFVRIAAGPGLGSVAGILSAASSSALYQLNVGGTVTKATLTPVFSGATAPNYDGAPKALSASTTPSTTVTLSYSGTGATVYGPSSSAPSNAGTYDVSATVSDSNYQGSANTTLTIGKASQTIVFGSLANKTVGESPFLLSASGGGSAQPVTFNSSQPTVAEILGNQVTIQSAGSSTITASQAGDANFTAAIPVVQTLTVNPAGQAITFGALAAVSYGNAPFALSATADSGLTVSFLSSDPTVASVLGNTVTILKAGSTTITASQAGDANFTAATPVEQMLTINPAPVTFASTFPGRAANDTVGGVEALVAYGLGGSPSGNNLTILPTSRYSGGTLQITFLARTNDPALTITVEGGPDLLNLTSPVTKQNGVSQTGVPVGFERQIWTLNLPGKGFMRVKTTLNP